MIQIKRNLPEKKDFMIEARLNSRHAPELWMMKTSPKCKHGHGELVGVGWC